MGLDRHIGLGIHGIRQEYIELGTEVGWTAWVQCVFIFLNPAAIIPY